MPFDSTLADTIGTYGAWIVGGTVAVESMGIPVPGETILVTAAVYAGTTGELSVAHVILAAMIGAIAARVITTSPSPALPAHRPGLPQRIKITTPTRPTSCQTSASRRKSVG